MSQGQKILLTLLSLLILGVLLLIYSSPPQVDWSPSYEQNDSRPLGSKVFYDQVKKVKVEKWSLSVPPFEAIKQVAQKATYVFINQYYVTDPVEEKLLIEWVSGGGHLFISASDVSSSLLDSLGLKVRLFPESFEADRTFTLSLESPMSLSRPATYDQYHNGEYFEWGDSLQVQTLGKIQDESNEDTLGAKPNFIQLRKGKGLITLHAFPEVFSNYFLLNKTNQSYTEQVLGIWDLNHPLLLDHYVKAGKVNYPTPLYLVLNNPYLKAAYLTCWVLLVLWVVFEGKRRQKAIRVISPPQNQSLAFAKTISSIYLKEKNMTQLGQLQLKLFWYHCRSKFNIHGENVEDSASALASKSGVSLKETVAILRQLTHMEAKEQLTSLDVQQIDQLIEEFKSKQTDGRNLQPAG